MSQKVFVPITDELLYAHPELLTALRPFNVGQPCFHWMAGDGDGATKSAPVIDRVEHEKAAA
ncbi:MAG: hypothetical protein ACR2P7_03805 [bacterium]